MFKAHMGALTRVTENLDALLVACGRAGYNRAEFRTRRREPRESPVRASESREQKVVAVLPRIFVSVYSKHRLDFSGEFTTSVELGRQRGPDEKLFTEISEDAGRRVAIAALNELVISRRHVRLDPLPGNNVRITNLSDRNTVLLADGGMIAGRQTSDLPLPVRVLMEEKSVQIDAAGGGNFEEPEIQSLAWTTLTPGSVCSISPTTTLTMRSAPKEITDAYMTWLAAVASVLQSATSSADFFNRAAQAMVDLVALDSGGVLMRDGDRWKPIARRTRRGGRSNDEWMPSRRILQRVEAEKRTFWRGTDQAIMGTESLMAVQAVVAAPVLDARGEVVAILYGDRGESSRLSAAGEDTISELEARLVDLLAMGVASGLSRIEQERKAMEAQVRFEQFFTKDLALQLAANPDLLRGRDTEVTMFFCDIRGFSRISERVGPALTVEWVGAVLDAISECVLNYEGALIDFIGDEVMAMWGAPAPQPDQARRACQAALDLWARLPELNDKWQDRLGEPIRFGIGINTGVARVGKTGSSLKFKYGPVGNNVNLASRVQGATKHLRTSVLITEATRKQLPPEFMTRPICQVRVVNITAPVNLYELVTDPNFGGRDLCQRYEEALTAFHAGRLSPAAKILGDILDRYPNDGPSVVLLSRVAEQLVHPSSQFDPAWELPGK
ncbi:MAG: adenylate/guanylate cyclase domain-containing protein [Planctomycetes bacterium]|nr:adenylate/guanylate cyclase domain-containing protein [Planctomycetota bacterium]